MYKSSIYITSILLFLIATSCIVSKDKNISYLVNGPSVTIQPKLNIFYPKKNKKDSLASSPVLIFVHGGNWNSGKKNHYKFLGKNFSKKGVITVIPDYTLSPSADYEQMTREIASSIQWVKRNISSYGGNPNKIFLMGHSAGGHLITLATLDPSYGISKGTVSGIILNDAAGLDMYSFLKRNKPSTKYNYLTTWTNDPAAWKKASPLYYVTEDMPPFLFI